MGSVRKRPSGSYEARWYGPDGRQHTRNFKKKADAERHCKKMEGDIVKGEYLDQSQAKTPFREVAEDWYETTARLKPSTRAGYRSIIDFHLVPAFGSIAISRIDTASIDRFIANLKTASGKPTGAGTARNVLRVLSPIMGYAVKARMIAANPVATANRPKVQRGSAHELPMLTGKQVDQLAEEVGPKSATLIYFAAYTGLRSGEVSGLRVRDLDLEAARVKVSAAITDVNGTLVPGTPKNGRVRLVTLPAFLVEMLQGEVSDKASADHVFPGANGAPRRHNNWNRRVFRRAVNQLVDEGTWPEDKRGFRFHDLRHTCASLCIANGEHPKAVQERLGHSSIAITMDRYGHLYEGADDAVAEHLNATFHAARPA